MKWNFNDYKKWVTSGCPINTLVTHLDIAVKQLLNIDKINNLPNLQILNCIYNKIINIQGLQLPNLQELYCSFNQIIDIQGLQLSNLQKLNCSYNNIINIEGLQLPNLQELDCSFNQIIDIKGLQLPNLRELYCYHNQIIDIQGLQLFNLQELDCTHNQIIDIDGLQLPNLQVLNCCDNNIRNLSILITNRLNNIYYSNNPVEYIAPNVQRFLNRSKSKQNVYNDSQNVHNHHIQECIRNSIHNIISIKPAIYNVNEYILNDNVFKETTKQMLFEYMSDTTVHSTFQITFEELLQCVLTVIDSNQHSKEIKEILNQEMLDSQCKCYTGRMSRLINCLNGYTDKVKVQISDVEQIGYVIQSVANELKTKQEYSIEKHKEKVKQELLERKYTETIIDEWIAYIE